MASAIAEMATQQATQVRERIGMAVPPKELGTLEEKIKSGSDNDIGVAMYELLCALTLNYDADPGSGEVTPNNAPDTLETTDEVAGKMTYLYKYGMRMVSQGLFDVDTLKDLIVRLLANRVNMSGEELDSWLDV